MERLFTCFSSEEFTFLSPKPQRIIHLRHLYFPLFITADIRGLKFLLNCYMSEIFTISYGGFLKYWLSTLPTSQILLSLSPIFTALRELINLSLTFLFWGWEPNFQLLPELMHISIVIQINDSFIRSLEKLIFIFTRGFCLLVPQYFIDEWMM